MNIRSGIFHDEQGTAWGVVAETAVSWFWPVALIALILALPINLLIVRIRSR